MGKNKNTYLTFQLNNEKFAVEISDVLEVLINKETIEVPNAPEYIKGIINFREEILPVVDFRKKFKFPENKKSKFSIIVFSLDFDDKEIKFGAIVDKVTDVKEVKKTIVMEAPEFGSKFNPEYLTGMISFKKKHVMILNIKKVFEEQEIDLIQEVKSKDIKSEEEKLQIA